MSSPNTSAWLKAAREEGTRIFIAVGIALIAAFIIILFASDKPFEAFNTFLTGPVSSKRTIGLWISEASRLTVAGLAFSLVFQARQFALGVHGQVYVGGLAAAMVAISPIGTTWLGLPLGVLAAMAAGAVYGFVPGYAKAKLGANEIVSSLMLNYIAVYLITFMVRVPLSSGPGLMETIRFPDTSMFPVLISRTRVDYSVFLAVAAVFIVWFALYRTSWGLKLRLVGHNPRFAEYAGIKATFIMVSAMTASGALGGLLGSMFVQGQTFGKLTFGFENSTAFDGILIAIVAKERPFAVPIVAICYGYILKGAEIMGIRTDVPTEVISVVQALIIVLVASSFKLGLFGYIKRLMPSRRAVEAAQ